MSARVGIVGAGMAGLSCALALAGRADVTLYEARDAPGGRAETHHRDGCTYEVGANYLADADERVRPIVTRTLPADGLVALEDPIRVFGPDGVVEPGRAVQDTRWTYETGLDTLADRLLAAGGATFADRTRVSTLARASGDWRLRTEHGAESDPFDAVVLAAPAPRTADVLGRSEWQHGDRRRVRQGIEMTPFRTVLSVALHYDRSLERSYYALRNDEGGHDIGWVAREGAKPGHVPDDECVLLVQMAPEWSADHFGDAAPTVVDAAAEKTAQLVSADWLASPTWTDLRRWRYAQPSDGVATATRERARKHDLYLAGDWVRGEARLHAAIRSGLETGDRVADEL